MSSTNLNSQTPPTSADLSPMPLQELASLMDQQLTEHPKYGLAAFIHQTETENDLIFDRTTAWQVPILQDNSPQQVFMKCSQVGITVIAIITMLVNLMKGLPGLYVLPTKGTMYQFVKNRIDPILMQVPFYAKHYAQRREDATGSELKKIFRRGVKFAGSNVKSAFFEMPAGWYIIDERDLCEQKNLKYLADRIRRAKIKRWMEIGNPLHENAGIHEKWKISSQQEWNITCPHCNTQQTLTWEANCVRQVSKRRYVLRDRKVQAMLNKLRKTEPMKTACDMLQDQLDLTGQDARIYCGQAECQKVIDRHAPGRWIAKHPDRTVSGYHINQIFGDPNPGAIFRMYSDQMAGIHDPAQREHFYNNILGLPYSEKGNRITDQMLADAAQDYQMPFKLPAQIMQHDFAWTTAGCDVGNTWHLHISGMFMKDFQVYRVKLFVGQIDGPEELHDKCVLFNVTSGVIDAMPETRLARKFCATHAGWNMCWYTDNKEELKPDKKKPEIKINKTEALDGSLAEWDAGFVTVAMDFRSLDGGEFVEQMKAPVREIDPDTKKISWSKPPNDHHRHADTYDWLATRLPGAGIWIGTKGKA